MNDEQPATLSPRAALDLIRKLARDSNNVVLVTHAVHRSKTRLFTRRQIELCVQKGSITEGPFVNVKGNWQVSLFRHAAGEEMTCVVAIDWPSGLIIVTVF